MKKLFPELAETWTSRSVFFLCMKKMDILSECTFEGTKKNNFLMWVWAGQKTFRN